MPNRLAQEALGQTVHHAYAKGALMKIPSLEDYEERAAEKIESADSKLACHLLQF
jgi:hypothetical protein